MEEGELAKTAWTPEEQEAIDKEKAEQAKASAEKSE
jgi:hypothetical protein